MKMRENPMKKIDHSLLYKEFVQRENEEPRASYSSELEFYTAIKQGDMNKVLHFCKEPLTAKEGMGVLSKNSLQSMKYHFVITAAMITRYCIEGGMDFAAAYNLSDYYIMKADKCLTVREVSDLNTKMCMDYTKKMQMQRKQKVFSRHVSECVDYIYDHLHTRITVRVLAEHVQLSQAYLSRVFKQEMGMSISEYIQFKKLETSKRMLSYSDYSVAEIAAILAFPSHSYFSEVFRKQEHMTPLQYRAANFRHLEL